MSKMESSCALLVLRTEALIITDAKATEESITEGSMESNREAGIPENTEFERDLEAD